MNDIRPMELGKTWDPCRISRKLEIVVVSDVGSYVRCFLRTADKVRLFPGSLLGQILSKHQVRSGS